MKYQTQSPILFLIFNREQTTRAVLNAIRPVQPRRVYVAADGPRSDRPEDMHLTEAARNVINEIDWPCEIFRQYQEQNLGCRNAVISAIDWFFYNEQEGIILEDDCIPSSSFFQYCDVLLEKYRNDERIMSITGNNFQRGQRRGSYSYYFSRYTHIWGWATWQRSWKLYDRSLKHLELAEKEEWLRGSLSSEETAFWLAAAKSVKSGELNTWDISWLFTSLISNGLTATPNVNLVSNIGYGPNATHTLEIDAQANIPRQEMTEITHPPYVNRHHHADQYVSKEVFLIPQTDNRQRPVSLISRILRKMRTTISRLPN